MSKRRTEVRCRLNSAPQILWRGFAGDEAAEAEAHADFVEAAVEVLEEAALESEIGLLACEQVLHNGRESRTAAGELHHARGDRAEQELAEEHAFGEPGSELE